MTPIPFRTHPAFVEQLQGRLRVAVPLMVREPDSSAEGNLTAAVMVDLPTDVHEPSLSPAPWSRYRTGYFLSFA